MDKAIGVYKNVLSDSFCDKVIEAFDTFEETGITKTRLETDQVESTVKSDQSLFLPIDDLPMHHMNNDIYKEFYHALWEIAYKDYSSKYSILKDCAPHNSYTMKVQKTRPSEGYHVWHSEVMGREDCTRLLTWSAYLNDDFEAGETEFLYQQYRYKPNKGDIIIFPAGFLHTHRGNPPIGGDKYIITGWIEF